MPAYTPMTPALGAGSAFRGTLSTVTDPVNEKRDISEVIDFLSPFDTPFLDLVGRDSLKTPATQVRHEWLEDQLAGRSGTLGAAYTANDSEFTLAGSEFQLLLPGDQILVGDLVYRVTGGAPLANPVLVDLLRSSGGALGDATDAAHANAAAWRKVSHASQEGGAARNDAIKIGLGNPFNYTQIIKDWIIVTGTMEVIDRYGYANERAYQEMKLLRKLAIDLENVLLYGVRTFTAGPPRVSTMGGLFEYVFNEGVNSSFATVVDLSAARFQERDINDMLQNIFDNGGEVDFIVVNGTNKRIATDFALPRIRTSQAERTAGASVAVYESDFGEVDFILNRWLRADDIIFGARGQMGIGPLNGRQFTSRLLPHTIDGTWYEILGEYTMEVHRAQLSWGWIFNTSTSY